MFECVQIPCEASKKNKSTVRSICPRGLGEYLVAILLRRVAQPRLDTIKSSAGTGDLCMGTVRVKCCYCLCLGVVELRLLERA